MGNPCVSEMPHLLRANRIIGLSEFWVKSGPREEGRNDAGNGESLAATRVRIWVSADGDRLPMIFPKF